MPKQRVDRKRLLKEPDEFITTTMRAMAWLRRNSRWVTAGVIAVLVTGVAFWGWRVYQTRKEFNAQDMLSQAYRLYAKAIHEDSGSDSQDLLSKAVERLQAVTIQFPGTRAAWMAMLYRGRALCALGRYQEAQEVFEVALGSAPSGDDGTMRALAIMGLGQAHAANGQWQEAASAFERLRSEGGGAFSRLAEWELARCYEQQGRSQEAAALYESLLAKVSEPLEREMIQSRLSGLAQAEVK